MLPQGSIFQYGFLGGGQFKKYLKKWSFRAKSGGLFKKNPKNWTFHITWGSIQEWGSIRADTVPIKGNRASPITRIFLALFYPTLAHFLLLPPYKTCYTKIFSVFRTNKGKGSGTYFRKTNWVSCNIVFYGGERERHLFFLYYRYLVLILHMLYYYNTYLHHHHHAT